MRLPTQENCDPNNPEEVFLWLLVGMPGFGDSPFLVPDYLARPWSKHFVDAGMAHGPSLAALANEDGYIHVDQLPKQKIKMRPPVRGQETSLNGAVSWVDVNSPEPPELHYPDPSDYTPHEAEMIRERFMYSGKAEGQLDEPEEDAAVVSSGPQFDPTKHTAAFVEGYLYNASPQEKRRVIAREMASAKPRKTLLRKYKGV